MSFLLDGISGTVHREWCSLHDLCYWKALLKSPCTGASGNGKSQAKSSVVSILYCPFFATAEAKNARVYMVLMSTMSFF